MDMGWKTSVPCFPRRKSLWSFSARCPDELESVSHGIFVVVVVIVKMLSFGDDSLVSCIRDNSGHSHSLAAIGAWGGGSEGVEAGGEGRKRADCRSSLPSAGDPMPAPESAHSPELPCPHHSAVAAPEPSAV